mmetsp:Transcript_20562/g.48799  ORF Transcript_20562/g.48799 Transcript_20562/m.48799 type:complete len:583 (-) Transcript_20562:78-1826(-)
MGSSSSSSVGWWTTTIITDGLVEDLQSSFWKNPVRTTSSFLEGKFHDQQDWITLATTLLALLVAVSVYYVLLDKRKLTSTLGESLFTTPSFLDAEDRPVSFGKNWKRRRQTLAMFSCSLSFIMPAVLICHLTFLWAVYWFFTHKYYASGLMTAIYLLYCWFLDMAPTYGDRSPWLRGGRSRNSTTGSSTPPSFLSSWWDNACDYLPLLLVKTADLPAYEESSGKDVKRGKRKKYVLGYHPHGIIAVGAFCAFATDSARVLDLSQKGSKTEEEKGDDEDWIKAAREAAEEEDAAAAAAAGTTEVVEKAKNVKGLMKGAIKEDDDATEELNDGEETPIPSVVPSSSTKQVPRGFSTLFPQLDRRVVTLPQNFWTPLLREYFLSMGAVTSDRDTFRRYLASQHPGALVVVVGGAAESMVANTGTINLILEKRRGFVREAIHANASLVPVLGFGETDLYQLYDAKDPAIAKIQTFVKATFGFAMPFFKGREMFLKKIGVMPQRTPVVVVVGKPIPPPMTLPNNKPHHEFNPKIDRQNDKALNDDGKVLMEWHAKYVKSLNELYQEYKDAKWNMPGQTRSKSLRIIR